VGRRAAGVTGLRTPADCHRVGRWKVWAARLARLGVSRTRRTSSIDLAVPRNCINGVGDLVFHLIAATAHGSASSRSRADPAPLRVAGSDAEPLPIRAKSALGSLSLGKTSRAAWFALPWED
jgi:hypothetical protein